MNYTEISGHPSDFEVQYRFYTPEEGGRKHGPPFQGFRCDWLYEGDDSAVTGLYCIWPEFLNKDGSLILEGNRVPVSGTAGMWIVSHKFRVAVHRKRIDVGVRGYFMEGSHKVAEAVVSRVVGLHTNSEKDQPA